MGMPALTARKYDVWECVSALQKAIRRGLEADAMHWALELETVGLLPLAMNRLRIISQEDIGLADPQAVLFANQALDLCEKWVKGKNEAWRIALGNAVRSLARAKKSREGDHFQAAIRWRMANRPPLPIQDYALDKHTRRGKALGRGTAHFLADGTILNPPAVPDDYAEEAAQQWYSEEKETIAKAKRTLE